MKKIDLKRDWFTVLLGFCIMVCLFVFAYINKKRFAVQCDTDMYADMLLAKKMWEQKTLFPEGWVFGNQYYVVATPVLAALFYGLLGNTNTAMICATECMTALILGSFLWMFMGMHTEHEKEEWDIRKKLQYGLLGCLFILCLPISSKGTFGYGTFFYLQCSYYACYIIVAFIIFGDYIRSFSEEKRRYPTWAIALLLCFATGMQSLRQMLVAILPVLAYEVIFIVWRLVRYKMKPDRRSCMHLVRAISYVIANIAGAVVIKLMDVPHVSLISGFGLTNPEEIVARFQAAWNAFCMCIGIPDILSSETMWFYRLFYLFAIILVLWAAVCLGKDLVIRKKGTDEARIFVMCLFAVAGTIASGTFLTITLHINYFFMWYPLVVISGFIVLRSVFAKLRIVLVSAVCVCCMANIYFSTGMPGILYKITEEPNLARDMSAWAVNEGYQYVYGDMFTAPWVARYSGGALEAGYWLTSASIYEPNDYLNLQNIYGPEENSQAIYVFTNADEEEGLRIAEERGVQMTKVADFGVYRAYTAEEPLMDRSE